MKLNSIIALMFIGTLAASCSSSKLAADEPPPKIVLDTEKNQDSAKDARDKGWTYLLQQLIKEGVDKKLAEDALGSRDMPEREMLTFNLNPQEKHSLYKGVNTASKRKHAFEFYLQHKETFSAARQTFLVPEGVVLAILQVETSCGQFTGNSSVFPAIARLANARDPDILSENLKNNPKNEAAVYSRASYLESTFLPHLVAAFKIAENGQVHRLRGSFAGAMGLPQFMPDNILKYGADGNSDGLIDVYNPDDAIFSTAKYLKLHGWNSLELSPAKKRNVIWEYNRSTPYIDTVLNMADELQRIITAGKPTLRNVDSKKSFRKSPRPAKKLHPGAKRAH